MRLTCCHHYLPNIKPLSRYYSRILPSLCFGLFAGLFHTAAFAFPAFTIDDIRIDGLKRTAIGTVFNYLPVKTGDRFDDDKSSIAMTSLFKSGLFKNIQFSREGNILIITLEERPVIASIQFEGNSDLKSEDLTKALKNIGFAEGRIFDRAILERVELELQRQYFAQGKYGVKIESTVTPLDSNRVGLKINVAEGEVARIRQINIIGNKSFSDSDLLDQLQLTTGNWLSFIFNDNQYSRQKLTADLESLRAYYLDRGYINFSVDSTSVSISPDKENVYITINITEGDKYTVREVKLAGNLIVPEPELREKITIKTDDLFSRKTVASTTEAILERVGDEGYAFANVNPVPDVDNANKTVALTFFIDPGKRVYVRRINFTGNNRTRDEVMRREMRQMESGWISTKAVKRSKERLERLNYFDNINIETPLVPNHDDLVDINIGVEERRFGNFMAGVGFSQNQGILFNFSVQEDNFLGSGKNVGLSFNNSQVNTVYSFSYINPYSDIDGVSRGFNLSYRKTDAEEANLSRYATDVYGGGLTYGIPISEYNSVRLGFEYDHTRLKTTEYSPQEIFNFIKDHGDNYDSYRVSLGWSRDTRNNPLLPTKGTLQSLTGEVALPFSDLAYYKLRYRHQWFYPLSDDYTLLLEGEVGYGDGYGDTNDLPFFENFTAGGPRSVRGFEENTLGPLDTPTDATRERRPYGGNLKVVGSAEVLLPVPFATNVKSFRLSAFLDAGNVFGYNEDFDVDFIRVSTGLSAIWASPLGLLTISVAKPLIKEDYDQVQSFQFSIGTPF